MALTPLSRFSRPFGTPAAPTQPRKPFQPGRGLSVSEIMGQRENHATGYDENGNPLKPGTQFFSPGWNTSGVGPGTKGYRGTGVIGSAAGSLGSGGIPTSQRGRAEKFGDAFAEMPTWAMSSLMREGAGGLSQDWRYGGMGQLPDPTPVFPGRAATAPNSALMQEAADFRAVEQPVATVSPGPRRDSSDWFRSLLGQFIPSLY